MKQLTRLFFTLIVLVNATLLFASSKALTIEPCDTPELCQLLNNSLPEKKAVHDQCICPGPRCPSLDDPLCLTEKISLSNQKNITVVKNGSQTSVNDE